jgi:hypothetical protein
MLHAMFLTVVGKALYSILARASDPFQNAYHLADPAAAEISFA